MSADAGARIVRHETERLGGRGPDHFVDVDAHLVGNDLHLVDKADVDRAMDVLEQLREFRRARGTDWHHLVDHAAIQRQPDLETIRRATAAHLWNGLGRKLLIAGIFALG